MAMLLLPLLLLMPLLLPLLLLMPLLLPLLLLLLLLLLLGRRPTTSAPGALPRADSRGAVPSPCHLGRAAKPLPL